MGVKRNVTFNGKLYSENNSLEIVKTSKFGRLTELSELIQVPQPLSYLQTFVLVVQVLKEVINTQSHEAGQNARPPPIKRWLKGTSAPRTI